MSGPCSNGLVTMGLGCSNTLVTAGLGCCPPVTPVEAAISAIRGRIRHGRSAYKRTTDYIIISAKLMSYNDIEPDPQIVGTQIIQPLIGDLVVAVRLMGNKAVSVMKEIFIKVLGINSRSQNDHGND